MALAGRERLTEHLKVRQVLVVIDDIDSEAQLTSLLLPCQLHAESLVIVTSRDRKVLGARCNHVCAVQLLPEGYDTQLFEAWAFELGRPLWASSVLVQKMVACCGRLPLLLKVELVLMQCNAFQANIYCVTMV